MTIIKMLAGFLVLAACSVSHADVYKWVDENGKTRFSDKAPAEKTAENIEKELKKTNVDEASKNVAKSVSASTEKSNNKKTSDEELLDMKKRQKLEESIGKDCRKWQEDINIIASGAFVAFYDKDGNEEMVLERDRGKKLEEWKENYRNSDCEKLYPLEQ